MLNKNKPNKYTALSILKGKVIIGLREKPNYNFQQILLFVEHLIFLSLYYILTSILFHLILQSI